MTTAERKEKKTHSKGLLSLSRRVESESYVSIAHMPQAPAEEQSARAFFLAATFANDFFPTSTIKFDDGSHDGLKNHQVRLLRKSTGILRHLAGKKKDKQGMSSPDILPHLVGATAFFFTREWTTWTAWQLLGWVVFFMSAFEVVSWTTMLILEKRPALRSCRRPLVFFP